MKIYNFNFEKRERTNFIKMFSHFKITFLSKSALPNFTFVLSFRIRDFLWHLFYQKFVITKSFYYGNGVVVPLNGSRKHFHDRPFPRSRRVTTSATLADQNSFFLSFVSLRPFLSLLSKGYLLTSYREKKFTS